MDSSGLNSLPFYTRKALAESEDTSIEELEQLAEDNEAQIRFAVAMNASSTSSVLSKFSNEREKYIISELISNKLTPSFVLDRISDFILRSIDSMIHRGLGDDDYLLETYLCYSAVIHPNSSSELQEKALRSKFDMFRLGAASHKDTTPEALCNLLLTDSSPAVIAQVLDHAEAPEAVSMFLDTIGVEHEGLPFSYKLRLTSVFLPECKNFIT